MKIIGITGTFGSGKSEAAKIFAKLGAYLVDHDEINHAILAKGEDGYSALINEYGLDILNDNGEIDRSKVAMIAFSSKESVRQIQEILHPIIIKKELELVDKYKKESEYGYIVFDTPLLFEAGRDKVCDYTVVITADEDKIYDRVSEKFGLSKADAKSRISYQMSLSEKAKLADFVIENNGTINDLEAKVKELFDKVKT